MAEGVNPVNDVRYAIRLASKYGLNLEYWQEIDRRVAYSLENHPGVLFKALSVFALRDIDLTKIESRPLPGQPWEYLFYIDFAGHENQYNCQRALEHLQELTPFMRVLGSYPRHIPGEFSDE